MDVEGLLSTLKSDDIDIDESQTVETEDAPTEVITSTDEDVEASPISDVEEPQPEEKHGFFARLFGKG